MMAGCSRRQKPAVERQQAVVSDHEGRGQVLPVINRYRYRWTGVHQGNGGEPAPFFRKDGEMIQDDEKVAQVVMAMTEKEGKYLTFALAGEEYGLGILKIKEIIGMMPITSVPQTPPFIKGVINLRGKVIPVMDLRLRFGMPAESYSERTCIIVVEVGTAAATVQVGLAVDAVSEVLAIRAEDIEAAPSFGTRLATDVILGMAKMNGGIKILLDIDRVLSREEAVQATSQAA
jgi:purine-binding chemotaxis protein CheW